MHKLGWSENTSRAKFQKTDFNKKWKMNQFRTLSWNKSRKKKTILFTALILKLFCGPIFLKYGVCLDSVRF